MDQKVRRHTFKGLFGLVSVFGSGKTIKYFLQTFQPSVTDNTDNFMRKTEYGNIALTDLPAKLKQTAKIFHETIT